MTASQSELNNNQAQRVLAETLASPCCQIRPIYQTTPGVQVVTPFTRPDAAPVRVFVIEYPDHYLVTDSGETMGWLAFAVFKQPIGSANDAQLEAVNRICRQAGVNHRMGHLYTEKRELSELRDAVHAVTQASLGVAAVYEWHQAFALPTKPDDETVDE